MYCMVVDDSRMSRMILKKIIVNAHPDWKIIEASNGQEAVDLAKGSQLDIIFLDYNMPVMNGVEAARILRPLCSEAKIAFLTANVQDATKNLAKELNLDFIPKPITEDKILKYVE